MRKKILLRMNKETKLRFSIHITVYITNIVYSLYLGWGYILMSIPKKFKLVI